MYYKLPTFKIAVKVGLVVLLVSSLINSIFYFVAFNYYFKLSCSLLYSTKAAYASDIISSTNFIWVLTFEAPYYSSIWFLLGEYF